MKNRKDSDIYVQIGNASIQGPPLAMSLVAGGLSAIPGATVGATYGIVENLKKTGMQNVFKGVMKQTASSSALFAASGFALAGGLILGDKMVDTIAKYRKS